MKLKKEFQTYILILTIFPKYRSLIETQIYKVTFNCKFWINCVILIDK